MNNRTVNQSNKEKIALLRSEKEALLKKRKESEEQLSKQQLAVAKVKQLFNKPTTNSFSYKTTKQSVNDPIENPVESLSNSFPDYKLDVVLIGDIQEQRDSLLKQFSHFQQTGMSVGFIHIGEQEFYGEVKEQLETLHVKWLPIESTVESSLLVVYDYNLLNEKESLALDLKTDIVKVVILDGSSFDSKNIRRAQQNLLDMVNQKGKWYTFNQQAETNLVDRHSKVAKQLTLAKQHWEPVTKDKKTYQHFINQFIFTKKEVISHE
ncbi:hypothetical protein [Halalkalibacillus halophilus]|uniref:hypothetical protein n=1 Tax=Halalkalibacillus halophilus TaxID=392827 RepID=UPI00040EE100|nr:hypothetical protein [Halalkalibacillus halophilus]